MKFKKIIAISLLALSLFVTGCASSNATESTDTSRDVATEDIIDTTDTSPEDNSIYPITIEHAYGESVIEEKPENIASIGWGNQDVPLALGVAPVGTSMANFGAVGENGLLPWTMEAYEALGVIEPNVYSDLDGLNYEAIADSNPDVILATYSGITQEEYDTLSQIAPVIAYPEIAWQTYWREQALVSAKAIGMEEEGIDLVTNINSLIDEKVAAYPELDGKTAIFAWFNPADLSSFYVYFPVDPRAAYLQDMGLAFPQSIIDLVGEDVAKETFSTAISSENADKLTDIDIIVTYGDESMIETLQKNPLLSSIPAIANGAVVCLPNESELAAACNPTVLSIPATIDDYLEVLAQAANKAE